MTKRTQYPWLMAAVMLTVVLGCGYRLWSQNTSPRPFTAVKLVKMTSSRDNPSVQTVHHIAQRRDGAFHAHSLDERGGIVNLSLPEEKLHVTIDPALRIKSTRPVLNPGSLDRLTTRLYSGDRCSAYVGDTSVLYGEGSFLNIPVFQYGDVFDTAENRYLQISYLAPSLNCFELFKDYTWKDENAVVTARTIEEVMSLSMGDPDPSLFEVPASFAEVLPSVLHIQHSQLVGHPTPESFVERYTRSDERYLKARKQAMRD